MLRKGWQKIMRTINAVHRQMHVMDPQILGPHSSVPSTKGFLRAREGRRRRREGMSEGDVRRRGWDKDRDVDNKRRRRTRKT